MKKSFLSKSAFIIVPGILLAGGCSTVGKALDPDRGEDDRQKILSGIEMRLQVLEAKINSMADKLDATQNSVNSLTSDSKATLTETGRHPADGVGISVPVPLAANDPEGGFINDEAIQTFRKAMILFDGQKYPEAILAFSDFIEKYPNHALAGSGQYYIAESYFKQKEYKLALQEYQHLFNSYDRNTHISDALKQSAIAADSINDTESAARHRQILSSVFPSSPAAATEMPDMSVSKTPEDTEKESEEKEISEKTPKAMATEATKELQNKATSAETSAKEAGKEAVKDTVRNAVEEFGKELHKEIQKPQLDPPPVSPPPPAPVTGTHGEVPATAPIEQTERL